MKNYIVCLIAWLAVCIMCVLSAPAAKDQAQTSHQDTYRALKRYFADLRGNTNVIESILHKLENGDSVSLNEMAKRQGAWDMDYGWGGGRFGKRDNSNSDLGANRYDVYDISGRFERDVAHVKNEQ